MQSVRLGYARLGWDPSVILMLGSKHELMLENSHARILTKTHARKHQKAPESKLYKLESMKTLHKAKISHQVFKIQAQRPMLCYACIYDPEPSIAPLCYLPTTARLYRYRPLKNKLFNNKNEAHDTFD